jgi:hypothetical protein
MKEIPVTQGKVALVDDHWFDYLMQWKWAAIKQQSNIYYAVRKGKTIEGKQITIRMHRVIMATPDNQEVDHINHNGLCNLEENMRNCTHAQNRMNVTPSGKSKFRGVWFYKGKYLVDVGPRNNNIRLGPFDTEEEAARAYDVAAKRYYGEFAYLNFKDNG